VPAEGSQLGRRALTLNGLEVDQRLPGGIQLIDLGRIDGLRQELDG
jgi:hypothetical protein